MKKLLGAFALLMASSVNAAPIYYDLFIDAEEYGTVVGEFAGEDLDGDGLISFEYPSGELEETEVSYFDFTFSGNDEADLTGFYSAEFFLEYSAFYFSTDTNYISVEIFAYYGSLIMDITNFGAGVEVISDFGGYSRFGGEGEITPRITTPPPPTPAVPEPASAALLGLGMLALWRNRKRKG